VSGFQEKRLRRSRLLARRRSGPHAGIEAKILGLPLIQNLQPEVKNFAVSELCPSAGGELEQIQLLLGHASVQTTERYLGTKQDLVNAPNDAIKLRVVV
jgi:hypothetical protein